MISSKINFTSRVKSARERLKLKSILCQALLVIFAVSIFNIGSHLHVGEDGHFHSDLADHKHFTTEIPIDNLHHVEEFKLTQIEASQTHNHSLGFFEKNFDIRKLKQDVVSGQKIKYKTPPRCHTFSIRSPNSLDNRAALRLDLIMPRYYRSLNRDRIFSVRLII